MVPGNTTKSQTDSESLVALQTEALVSKQVDNPPKSKERQGGDAKLVLTLGPLDHPEVGMRLWWLSAGRIYHDGKSPDPANRVIEDIPFR